MATQISALYAKISADTSSFEKGMKSSHTALASFSAALGTGLVAAAALGVAAIGGVATVIGKGVGAAASFEQSIADIASTMGKTSAEIEPLKKLIMDLGLDPKLKVSTNEAAAAIASLVKNGLTMDQVLQGAAKSTVLLANATGADFGTAADIATDVMQQFNISAADMDKAVNGILGVTQASKFSVNDYQLAIGQAGGVASSVGVEFDDFNAALAATSFNFKDGSNAGTSFRQFLSTITPTTEPAKEAMKELGLITADGSNKFYDAAGNMKSMTEMADILQDATAGLSEEQKKLTFQTIFGNDASNTAYALAKVGGEEIAKLKGIIGNTDAEAAAATRMDTLSGQWEIFRGVLEATSIKIGDAFLPAAKKIVEWAQAAADKHLPTVIAWFERFGAWIVESLPKIEAFIGKLGGWAGAFMDWATGSDSSMSLVATAATWMGTKVSEAFRALVEWIKTNLPIWVAQLKEWGAAAGAWIMETGWPLLVANLRKWGANLWAWIKENYPIWKENLREWGEAAGNWITDVGWPRLKKNMENWWIRLKEWAKNQLPYWIKELAEWAIQLGAWAIDGISFLISTLADGMHEVKMWLRGTGQDGVKEGTGGYAAAFVKWIKEDAWPILKPALQGLIKSLVDLAGQSVGLIFDAAMAVGRAIVNGMIEGAKDMWRNATALWRDLPQNVIDTFNYMFGIHSPSKVFYDIGVNVVKGFAFGIQDNAQNAVAAVKNMGAAVTQAMLDAQTEIALRNTFAGIRAGEMANVANQIITQNNATGAGSSTSGYNYMDEVYANIARQQAVQDAAYAARQAAAQEAAIQHTYESFAGVFAGTNYQQYLDPYGSGAQLSGYGEGKVSAAVNLLEQLKSAGGVEAVSKGYNITIENMNLGGSGNAVTDIIQAINFLNASYGYGY